MAPPTYDTIVVPTDLSDPSLAAVDHAGTLADRLGSRIVLVYVMADRLPPMILAHTPRSEQELMDEHRAQALESLSRVATERLPGREVDCVVREGVDHQEIVSLAREIDAGMIVIGMHGHGFLVHALVGSTAERVLHHAGCPVLVVGHDH